MTSLKLFIVIAVMHSVPSIAMDVKSAKDLCQDVCDHKCNSNHGHNPERIKCLYASFESRPNGVRRSIECRFRGSLTRFPGKVPFWCCGVDYHYHIIDGGALPPRPGGF